MAATTTASTDQKLDSKPDAANDDDTNNTEISLQVSQRICKHMNEDHPITVFGMAQASIFKVSPCANGDGVHTKITSATLIKITTDGCEIKVVKCSVAGDLCEMETILYPFSKRLTTPQEIKQELIAIHSQVLAPSFLWLVLKPRCVAIIALDVMLFIGTFLLGMRGGIVQGLFWFLVAAHLVEGSVGVYYCRFILKVNWKTTKQWFVCILPVGLPIMRELKELCTIARQGKSSDYDGDGGSSKKLS